jgi:hypothetical protein
VLTVLSWRPPCCATQAEWDAQVGKAVTALRSKYAGGCPAPPATDECIAMPQEFDAAPAAVAATFPGMVFVSPKTEAPSCAAFDGGGPHLTNEGNAAVANAIGAYFVKHQ